MKMTELRAHAHYHQQQFPLMNMRFHLIRMMRLTAAAGVALLLSGTARAAAPQGDIGPSLISAGTTWHDAPSNQDWAYLTWFSTGPMALGGKTYALYAKPGAMDVPGTFRRVAITSLQTDPRVIEPLLQRSVNVGQSLVDLESDMSALFGKFIPAGLTRAQQVAAVITGTLTDEKRFGNLLLLGRNHPGMATCLGIGHVEPIGPGQTTFEIRQFDPITERDIAVVGRLSVAAGAPTVLPSPGAPVQMPGPGARGNMNAILRWATPDPLRRLMILQNGFNVYRVRKDYAVAPGRNWHVTPPPALTLLSALNSTQAVQRINPRPILTSTLFTPGNVGNFDPTNGDATTMYLIDDNRIGHPTLPPLTEDYTNGARFLYFVAARDLLGRDGFLSAGTEVLICDKLMPNPMGKIRVVNDYLHDGIVNQHALRVLWPQASNAPTSDETIKRYWVYRWRNTTQINSNLAYPSNNLIAIVNHLPGVRDNTYLDNGPGSPTAPADYARTFWYTVRAEDIGACGGNLSPHSAAVSGTLREYEGPAAPNGTVRGRCLSPFTQVNVVSNTPGAGTPAVLDFAVEFLRDSDRIAWMEGTVEIRNGTNILTSTSSGPLYFMPGSRSNLWRFKLPGQFQVNQAFFRARAGMNDGQISGFPLAVGTVDKLQEDTELRFRARSYLDTRREGDCDIHVPIAPGGSNNIVPIEIEVGTTPGTREYRLYRRVDEGPLQLICQRTNPPPIVICFDFSFSSGGSRICYYAQFLDEHGNGSPLKRLGCKLVAPLSIPKPMLTEIDPTGSEAVPEMRLRWFCPPYGVERFQIGISKVTGSGTNDGTSSPILNLASIEKHILPANVNFLTDLVINQQTNNSPPPAGDFGVFITPVIGNGAAYGSGPEFILPVKIAKGIKYAVWVRAVSATGEHGEKSNIETFYWEPPETNTLPTVAWPKRPLPPVGSGVGAGFVASWYQGALNNFTGAVVRIGQIISTNSLGVGTSIPAAASDFSARPQALLGTSEPMVFLQKTPKNQSPFPCVLYRHQVPNAKFPNVSGDIIQCSPLMESIAFEKSGTTAIVWDPFVMFEGYRFNFGSGTIDSITTLLRDSQPVVAGASYKYILVRFGKDGEIAEVLATNEMEVP